MRDLGTCESNVKEETSRGYIGITENKMETIIVYWGLYRDNGKEHGNYYSILGLHESESKLLVSSL